MPTEYTIIAPHRHRLGDDKRDGTPIGVDQLAHFDGPYSDFEFRCPNVHSGHEAILQFQHRGSSQRGTFLDMDPENESVFGITREHPVTVNEIELPGGVPLSPSLGHLPIWSLRSLIVPVGILRELNIVKFVTTDLGKGNLDDYIIDNIVIFYKTADRHGSNPGNAGVIGQ